MDNTSFKVLEPKKEQLEARALLNLSVEELKTFMAYCSESTPAHWNIQMAIAVKEGRPMDVLRIGGSHSYPDDSKEVASELLDLACEMIQKSGILEDNSPESSLPSSKSSTPSSSSSSFSENSVDSPLFAALVQTPKRSVHLPSFVVHALKKHFDQNEGKISSEDAEKFAEIYSVEKQRILNYFKNRRGRSRKQ